MKKTMLFAFVIVAAAALALPQMVSAAGPNAWGHGTYTLGNGGLTGVPDATYQLSSNVYLYYANDTTNNHAHYAVSSLHKSGNRSFATSDNTTLIYYWTKTVGATVDSNAVQTAGTTTFSNGTAL
jgi:hypothetical protein